jgi:hypothetical protein
VFWKIGLSSGFISPRRFTFERSSSHHAVILMSVVLYCAVVPVSSGVIPPNADTPRSPQLESFSRLCHDHSSASPS